MWLGPARPHWRHLHWQGSAACSNFPTGLAGRGASCCPLLPFAALLALLDSSHRNAAAGKGALSVALSQKSPLQHHPVRMPNLHREHHLQLAGVKARRSSLYGGGQQTIPITLAGVAIAPGSPRCLASLHAHTEGYFSNTRPECPHGLRRSSGLLLRRRPQLPQQSRSDSPRAKETLQARQESGQQAATPAQQGTTFAGYAM